MPGPPGFAPELLATTCRPPEAGVRPRFRAGLGLQDRDFLRRKGKGYTLGGQANGNSWQRWLPSRECRAGLGVVMEGLG